MKIIKTFSNEKIIPRYLVLDYQIDLYFLEHELAIEVDEKGHTDRDGKKRKWRRTNKKKNLHVDLLELSWCRKSWYFWWDW